MGLEDMRRLLGENPDMGVVELMRASKRVDDEPSPRFPDPVAYADQQEALERDVFENAEEFFEHLDALRSEVRTTSSTGGQKGVKPQRMDLVPPLPLLRVAEVFGWGAGKYVDHNWRRGYEWSKSYAALQRHLLAWWNREDTDPESGLSHMAHVAWHALVLLQFENDFPEFDDRYTEDIWS